MFRHEIEEVTDCSNYINFNVIVYCSPYIVQAIVFSCSKLTEINEYSADIYNESSKQNYEVGAIT